MSYGITVFHHNDNDGKAAAAVVYHALDDLQGFTDDRVRICGTSKANDTSIIIEPDMDLDEKKR